MLVLALALRNTFQDPCISTRRGSLRPLGDAGRMSHLGHFNWEDEMKNAALLFSSFVLAAASVLMAGAVSAQSLDDLKNDHKTTGDVLTYGMGYNNQRYSPLRSINKGNVGKLVPVWNYSLNNPQGQESQPIVYQGVMYVTSHTSTVAIDALTGKQVWKHELEFTPE